MIWCWNSAAYPTGQSNAESNCNSFHVAWWWHVHNVFMSLTQWALELSTAVENGLNLSTPLIFSAFKILWEYFEKSHYGTTFLTMWGQWDIHSLHHKNKRLENDWNTCSCNLHDLSMCVRTFRHGCMTSDGASASEKDTWEVLHQSRVDAVYVAGAERKPISTGGHLKAYGNLELQLEKKKKKI